jgi:hypothetical protein
MAQTHGWLHEPRTNVGRRVRWSDGSTTVVYRETVSDVTPTETPTTLVVSFRLRGVRSERLHRLFRLESELNTILFAGFPGFVRSCGSPTTSTASAEGCTTGATPSRPRRTSAHCGGP